MITKRAKSDPMIEKNILSLQDVSSAIIKAQLVIVEENIATLEDPGIIIVRLIEYKKLRLSQYILMQAIRRGYELRSPVPEKVERVTLRALPGGSPSDRPSSPRPRRRLSLVRI